MRGLQISKRVSWASDVNLCQVRLFLSEESPSQVGIGAQDHLQAKALWSPNSNTTSADDILPPGFEGGHPPNLFQIKVSEVPVIKWRYAPRFVLDITWQVVAGEESKEVEVQNQREMRVLEAVYPRASAIPPNPIFNTDIETQRNDHQTPLIPILPIEDEDVTDTSCDMMAPCSTSINSQSQPLVPGISPQHGIPNVSNTAVNEKATGGMPLGVEPDVMAAASAAFAAINKSNENGSVIDQDLLAKILSNPELVEKLVNDYGAAANAQNIPKPAASFVPLLSDPLPPAVALSGPSHLLTNRIDTNPPSSLLATSTGSLYTTPNGVGQIIRPNMQVPPTGVPASSATPSIGAPQVKDVKIIHPNMQVPPTGVPASSTTPSIGAPQVKDVNYYKSLIQQHGGERQETPQQYGSRYSHQVGTNQEIFNHQKSRDLKPKVMKPCIYFNSSRGCRNGANCTYQHDTSSQQKASSGIVEVQSLKRMKMDREISSS